MAAGKSSRINRQYKTKYRIRNWRGYERGLRSRGDVTIWLSEDAIAAWIPPKNGLRGGQRRELRFRAISRAGLVPDAPDAGTRLLYEVDAMEEVGNECISPDALAPRGQSGSNP